MSNQKRVGSKGHIGMNRYRLSIVLAVLALVVNASAAEAQVAERPTTEALNWESANAKRMFVITNESSPIVAISLDTTHKEDLQAALKLQELIFRLGGARLPIVDKSYVKVPWRMIHIRWDHYPMSAESAETGHPFEISMEERDPTAFNPEKRIIIAGRGNDVERAVSAFTQSAFGVPLKALDDKSFKSQPWKVLAIPEKMETIHGQWQRK